MKEYTNNTILLEEFIEWLRNQDDVWYAFDMTDEAIHEFLKQRDD